MKSIIIDGISCIVETIIMVYFIESAVTANQTSGQKNEPRSTSAQILYSVHHNELL